MLRRAWATEQTKGVLRNNSKCCKRPKRQGQADSEAESPQAFRVPVLQFSEPNHVPLPETLHERGEPGAEAAAEGGGCQPRLGAVLRPALRHLGVRQAAEGEENGEQLVGFGERVRRQHVPCRLREVEYCACAPSVRWEGERVGGGMAPERKKLKWAVRGGGGARARAVPNNS
jgi:hypothetical protein